MELPLQITFHSLARSDAITDKVRHHAQKLGKYCDGVQSCRVAVEAPHHHHATGNGFRVRVEVLVPGQHLVVTRGADAHRIYTDVYAAIRDAFFAMRRQLIDYSALLREHAKAQ